MTRIQPMKCGLQIAILMDRIKRFNAKKALIHGIWLVFCLLKSLFNAPLIAAVSATVKTEFASLALIGRKIAKKWSVVSHLTSKNPSILIILAFFLPTECSRLINDLKKDQDNIDVTFHCSTNGNFERLQCNRGMCYCANVYTGQPYSAVVPEQWWTILPCCT